MISYLAIILIGGLVGTILIFLTLKGIALFKDNGVSIWHFLTSTDWQPSHHHYGALPMIITSFSVTVFSGIIALPLALVVAIAITEMLPKKTYQYLQPLIELLVGIPSVVYGYLGLTVIVPNLRQVFGGTGFGILAATSVLFLMILPTMTSMTIDSLQAVPPKYRQASAGLGGNAVVDYFPGNNPKCKERDFNSDGLWNDTSVWGGISGSNGNWKYNRCAKELDGILSHARECFNNGNRKYSDGNSIE